MGNPSSLYLLLMVVAAARRAPWGGSCRRRIPWRRARRGRGGGGRGATSGRRRTRPRTLATHGPGTRHRRPTRPRRAKAWPFPDELAAEVGSDEALVGDALRIKHAGARKQDESVPRPGRSRARRRIGRALGTHQGVGGEGQQHPWVPGRGGRRRHWGLRRPQWVGKATAWFGHVYCISPPSWLW